MSDMRWRSLARPLVGVLLAVVCLASTGRAEVHLVPAAASLGTPSVQILPTARGPWSLAIGSKLALNAQGNLMSDGFPAIAVGPAGALVAWSRPLDGSLQLAAADARAWVGLSSIPASVIGTPVAWLVPTGGLVAWTDGSLGALSIRVAATDGRSTILDSVDLGPGRVIDGVTVDELTWLLGTDEATELLLATPVRLGVRPGGGVVVLRSPFIPIPVERTPGGSAPVLSLPAPLASIAVGRGVGQRPPPTPVPILTRLPPNVFVPFGPSVGTPRGSGRRSAPSLPAAAPPPPFGDAKLNVIDRRGEEVVVVTAWSAPDALTFSELSEFGIVGATETITAPAGYAPYSPVLVRWALQAVASR